MMTSTDSIATQQPIIDSDELSVTVDNICKTYTSKDKQEAIFSLKNISFQLKKGDVLGIVGHNGSGKSTLLKIIANLVKPTSGNITLNGSLYAILDVGSGFHPDLTGKENIEMMSRMNNRKNGEIQPLLQKVIDFSEIGDFINEPVKNYSQGMYLRLAFSLFIHLDADIIVIDELLSVGDIYFRKKCEAAIRKLQEVGKTLIIVSHDFNQINALCNKCALIENGEIKFWGDSSETYHPYIESVNKEKHTDVFDFHYEDESIKLNNIFINNKKMQGGAEIYGNEALQIIFNFVKKKKTDSIIIHLDFLTANNQLIVCTSNVFGLTKEELAAYLKQHTGELNIILSVPPDFFNTGLYRLVFNFSKYDNDINQAQQLFRYKKGIPLYVNESLNSNFSPMNLAPIRTKFSWELNAQ